MQLGLVGLGKMGFDMPAPAPKAQVGSFPSRGMAATRELRKGARPWTPSP
jgi:6-phosphogluconate dehydrogenase (decarboxylating)